MKKSSVQEYFEKVRFDLELRLFPEALPFEIDILNMFFDYLDWIIANYNLFDDNNYKLTIGEDGKFYFEYIPKKTQNSNPCGDSSVEVENLD